MAAAEATPRSGDDHLLLLELGEVRLRIGPAVPPERVAALVAGKKRMRQTGKVEVPPEAFINALKMGG